MHWSETGRPLLLSDFCPPSHFLPWRYVFSNCTRIPSHFFQSVRVSVVCDFHPWNCCLRTCTKSTRPWVLKPFTSMSPFYWCSTYNTIPIVWQHNSNCVATQFQFQIPFFSVISNILYTLWPTGAFRALYHLSWLHLSSFQFKRGSLGLTFLYKKHR